MENNLYRLIVARGHDTFGLTVAGRNLKHALARAKAMLVDSGYHVYPYKEAK